MLQNEKNLMEALERARDRLNSMALEAQRRGEPLCGEMILKQNSMVEMLSNAAQQAGLLPVAQAKGI